MRTLVTGADGFVGRYLVRALLDRGDDVVAAVRPGGPDPEVWLPGADRGSLATVDLELTTQEPFLLDTPTCDRVVHLAALASGADSWTQPDVAWAVNVLGTLRLLQAVAGVSEGPDPMRVLMVSTAEVYGAGENPRTELDPVAPLSPYAASKAAAELAAGDAARRAGMELVVARPFPHTGVGQGAGYVVPSFLGRLIEARDQGATSIATGNLDPVRDIMDVRDVVTAYLCLLDDGAAGETYNVAGGVGYSVRDVLRMLADRVGVEVEPRPDPRLQRPADIPRLVGDATKLREATGWAPQYRLEQTLTDMVHAQAH